MQQASKTLRTALAAVEFGQLAGSAEERQQLRAAIDRARTAGVEAAKVGKAEDQFRLTAAKAEAAVAAERAAREAAAAAERAAAEQAIREEREREERAVLMQEAREILRRSVSRPSEERKKILRDLQVKWHPDKFAGGNDEKAKEFAAELSQKANEAARIAKMQAKEAAAKQRRMAAYGKLQGMSSLSVEQLTAAIDEARAAGVSDMEIAKAENKLKGLARAGDPQGVALKAAAMEAEAQAAEDSAAERKQSAEDLAEVKAAERSLGAAMPLPFQAADVSRLEPALAAAKRAGVSPSLVASAEKRLQEAKARAAGRR